MTYLGAGERRHRLVEVKEQKVANAVLALLVDEVFTLMEGTRHTCWLGFALRHNYLLSINGELGV